MQFITTASPRQQVRPEPLPQRSNRLTETKRPAKGEILRSGGRQTAALFALRAEYFRLIDELSLPHTRMRLSAESRYIAFLGFLLMQLFLDDLSVLLTPVYQFVVLLGGQNLLQLGRHFVLQGFDLGGFLGP